MRAFPSVPVAIAVIASLDDVQQTAGRPAVGVVVDGKEVAEGVEPEPEGVPESGRHQMKLAAIRPAAVNVSAFAALGKRLTVGADQVVGLAGVLAQREVDVAERIEGHP